MPSRPSVEHCSIPERSLKRRFATATGSTLIHYVQNLRIEEAKRLLEAGGTAADDIAALVGYENPAFFRRLFKRTTGLTPGAYRRMFQPLSKWPSRRQRHAWTKCLGTRRENNLNYCSAPRNSTPSQNTVAFPANHVTKRASMLLADGEGFEPPVRVNPRRFSRPVP